MWKFLIELKSTLKYFFFKKKKKSDCEHIVAQV